MTRQKMKIQVSETCVVLAANVSILVRSWFMIPRCPD